MTSRTHSGGGSTAALLRVVVLLFALSGLLSAQSPGQELDRIRTMSEQNPTGAWEAAERFVRLNPDDAEAWFVLGVLRSAELGPASAADAYRKTTGLNPRHVDAWSNLGDLLRRTGKPEEALEALHHARAAEPKHPRVALNIALTCLDLRRFEEALAAIATLETEGGRSPIVDYLRSKTLIEAGDLAGALPAVQQFKKGTPQNVGLFLDLARVLVRNGAAADAAGLIDALAAELRSPETDLLLGQAWYAADQMQNANQVFERLSAASPGDRSLATWVGHSRRALGDIERARTAYESAIRLDPRFAEALTELANLELDSERIAEAEAFVSQALAVDPSRARSRFVGGLVSMRRERWTEAIERLAVIAPSEPEYAQSQYMLSRSFRQTGEAAKAEAAMAEFRRVSEAAAAADASGRKRPR